jgi:hypothetical protein
LVNRIGLEPSLSEIQISQLPDCPDVQANFFPSAERAGCTSGKGEVVSFLGASSGPPAPGARMRQMLLSITELV